MTCENKKSIKDLDYSSPDCLLLIREYTALIKEINKKFDLIVEENNALHSQIIALEFSFEQINSASSSIRVVEVPSADSYYQECINMQHSLSWRITKPLRLAKKVWLSWK
jgi:hypothetical protein